MRILWNFIWTAAGAALFLLAVTVLLYRWVFGRRFESDSKPLPLTLSDYPALIRRPVVFQSHGETLCGGFYHCSGVAARQNALLIFCHGLSNGSRDYLGHIDFWSRNGFEVLAYDNTGCHESSGKGVNGFPQSAINLSDVLDTLLTHPDYAAYREKPLILMGHSWGGYAVASVLALREYKTVKAVVTFAAPNRGLDMILAQGRHRMGIAVYLFKPFLWTIERLKFRRYARLQAVNGINCTRARVLVIQSKDDLVVSYSSSLAAQKPHCTNPHAEFLLLEDRGHNPALTDAARAYAKQLRAQIAAGVPLDQLIEEANRMQLYALDEPILHHVLNFLLSALEPQ